MHAYINAYAIVKIILFSRFSSQETGLSTVSLEMIFNALQSVLFRIQFLFAEFKNPKIFGTQTCDKVYPF